MKPIEYLMLQRECERRANALHHRIVRMEWDDPEYEGLITQRLWWRRRSFEALLRVPGHAAFARQQLARLDRMYGNR